MSLPPALAGARRAITIAGLALIALALVGALAYSFQSTGNDCGSGWAAATKPIPSPLLTPEEQATITQQRRNPYEAGIEKARPIRECRSAGASRLIRSGVGFGLVLIPVGALLAFLNWPRRAEPVDVIDVSDEPPGPTATAPGRGGVGDGPGRG